MAKITVAQLNAKIAALESALEGKDQELAHLASRVRHDYVEVGEYRRVQALLRTTQQFYAKAKRQAQGTRPPSERRALMDHAKALAMDLGRSVTLAEAQADLARVANH